MKTCTCGAVLTRPRVRVCAQCRAAASPFGGEPRYGTYEGPRGGPDQWADAFHARFSQDDIQRILGTRSPWDVLGLAPGATAAQIKSAYRARARATHPDLHPDIDRAEFQAVQAAYDALTF